MKKSVFAAALAVVMASASVTAFATENPNHQLTGTGTANTAVTYEVDPGYTVTIPKSITLGETLEVKAENVTLYDYESLVVSISATSEEDNSFKLRNGLRALTYTITKGEDVVDLDSALLTVGGNASSGTAELKFNEPETAPTVAGTYSGTVTFNVRINGMA